MAAKRAKRERVELVGMLSVDDRIRWLVLDVMRLQNQYAEVLRALGALQVRVDRMEHPKRKRRQRG